MATRRKTFTPRVKTRTAAQLFNEFIKALLAGTITATKLVVAGTARKPELRYDDPNG